MPRDERQATLGWVARWRATGQTTPAAPKGVFWILLAAWFAFVMMIFLLFSLVMFGTRQHG